MSISSPQSFNRYSYVNNDPVNKVDPTGLMLSDIGVYQTSNPGVVDKLEKRMVELFQQNTSQGSSQSTPGLNQFASPAFRASYGNRPWAKGGKGAIQFSSIPNPFMYRKVWLLPGGNVIQNMRNLASNPTCSGFISKLINVASQLTGRKPYSDNINELINLIIGQPDNSGLKGIEISNGYHFSGVGGGGSAFGDIGRGEATAEHDYFWTVRRTPTESDFLDAEIEIAIGGLHETVHVAGGAASAFDGYTAYYNDTIMANAAQILTNAPNFPESGSTNAAYGMYWHNQLRENCYPK
jgi:hypothetical protein